MLNLIVSLSMEVVKLNFEFDEAKLSIEDKIILDHLSLVTHVAEA